MAILHYFVDPMCSWCYAFSTEMDTIVKQLPADVPVRYLMGGLAPDSDEPMPPETQAFVQQCWHTIAERTGTEFNFDFWTTCQPQRSTYPACRAVIAASQQGEAYTVPMLAAIQKAYYRQARNPSDIPTLVAIAGEIGLDTTRFEQDIHAAAVQEQFTADLQFRANLGVQGFPTLILETDNHFYALTTGYTQAETVASRLTVVLNGQANINAT